MAAVTDTADCEEDREESTKPGKMLHLHILPLCQGNLGVLKQNQSLKELHLCSTWLWLPWAAPPGVSSLALTGGLRR